MKKIIEQINKARLVIVFLFAFFLFGVATINAQIGIGTPTPNASAKLDVSSTTKGFLPPRMTHIERNAIPNPATGLMIWCNDCGVAGEIQVYNGTMWTNMVDGIAPHFIGENYGGGIVFYLYDNNQHGLIAATTDQTAQITWDNNNRDKFTGATGDGLGAGAMNTALIISQQMPDAAGGKFAAKACADYSVTWGGTTYGDWYLPSKYELNLLWLQRNVVGGFDRHYDYWSSTESNYVNAWHQEFLPGHPNDGKQFAYAKGNTYYVRAIRAF